jgi:hypothetical protein
MKIEALRSSCEALGIDERGPALDEDVVSGEDDALCTNANARGRK